MAHPNQDRRPDYSQQSQPPVSPLTRPRYVSLIGGAITALSITLFGAFAGVQTLNQPLAILIAIGFSVAVHYLFATFTNRAQQEPGR